MEWSVASDKKRCPRLKFSSVCWFIPLLQPYSLDLALEMQACQAAYKPFVSWYLSISTWVLYTQSVVIGILDMGLGKE